MRLLDTIEKIDKKEYSLKYENEITWSCVLSDGNLFNLKPNGSHKKVAYEERLEYCEQVKLARLSESDKQVN